jgi:hypothetical protein
MDLNFTIAVKDQEHLAKVMRVLAQLLPDFGPLPVVNNKAADVIAPQQPASDLCPVHGVELKVYQRKDGSGSFKAHKLAENGNFCYGKRK